MVKSYLRYEPYKTFGIIASSLSNSVLSKDGKLAITPALEDVVIWDIKKDGSIRLWNIEKSSTSNIFNGHRGAITALTFDQSGTRLASGSKDTDLIVWDVVGEIGLYRMRGHKDQITSVKFLSKSVFGINKKSKEILPSSSLSGYYLISSSKDTLLKLWDLSTQHCMETIVAHRSEIWNFDISQDESLLVTGGDDNELKIWTIDHELLTKGSESKESKDSEVKRSIKFYGSVTRQSKDRVVTLAFHPKLNLLGVQGAGKIIEFFRINKDEEIKKKLARRKKREKEKRQKLKESVTVDDVDMDLDEKGLEIRASDAFTSFQIIRTDGKIRSFDFSLSEDTFKTGYAQVLVSLTNNMLALYKISLPSKKGLEPQLLYTVEIHGHRNDIRTLALSLDDELLCSASKDTLKIWNVRTTTCIRTMECGFAFCSAFVPGNRYVILGTKTGQLELFDISSSSLIGRIDAHESQIWSIDIRPDQCGISIIRHLKLVHNRTLKMSDDVLCVKYSPNQKFVAVALLDSTVKVFYDDTLKFFLSLYGHKLPVISMDISSDNKLIVTGSADKNIKIWGLDFGDCHKSIFAHQDNIMCVKFVPNTHYIFTASKDKLIKYWDGDNFENIMKIEGHHGEIYSLIIGKHGDLIISASRDRSIRFWEQTDEPLFLEEEREKELEELYESTLTESMEKTKLEDNTVEVSSAGKQTMETLKAGERIIEALDIANENDQNWITYNQLKEINKDPGPPPKPNPILVALGNLTGDQYVLRTIEKVRSTELEEALLILPFNKLASLLNYLDIWAKKEWNVPLTCRILLHLLKIHHDQIVTNRLMRPRLDSLRTNIRNTLMRQKDLIGYNIAALKYIRRDWESNNIAEFFDELTEIDEIEGGGSLKKRKLVNLKS
ncbi:3716_t:CDS:10 [Entrophospora sp. SA101]|nr:3716_t:CDS:10 [Entrophospora sp. SA101]